MRLKPILFLLFLTLCSGLHLAIPVHVAAQSANQLQTQMDAMRQELAKRGLTENEVRARLIQRGIILENIPPNEISRYQTQIMEVIAELEAEKRGETPPGTPTTGTNTRRDPNATEESEEEESEEARRRRLEREKAVADSIALMASIPDIYGHTFFLDGSLKAFNTMDAVHAPDSYVIGPGDKLRVTIFGVSQADLQLEVNPAGFVQPAQSGRIFLQGITLGQARELLKQRLSNSYTFRSDQIAVTMQVTRTVTVQVLGEARKRGTYAVSPLNSAFNAVALAGGPDSIGTVRRIEWVRGTTRRTLDLYGMLSDPTLNTQLDLQSGDVVFIPPAGPLVRAEGAVRRPMRYEMIPGETVADLIRFAGGLDQDANPDIIQIQRFERGESVLIETTLDGNFPLRMGDIVRVRRNRADVSAKIGVGGAVFYPGYFGFKPDMTVADALDLAGGLLPGANNRAYLERRELTDTTQVSFIAIDLFSEAGKRTPLRPNDRISVYDRALYSNVGEVGISGAVKQYVRLGFSDDLQVSDLVIQAGGVVVGAALNRVQVFRTNIYPDKPSELVDLVIQLGADYRVIHPENFKLQPYDEIVIRLTPGFQLRRTVEINGEVNYPGSYTLENRQLHLSDLITKAGGLRDQADPIGATLFRTYGNRGFIVTNLNQALRNPRSATFDPILMAGDVININRRENTVTIQGDGVRLGFAVSDSLLGSAKVNVTYQGEKSALWYIERYAGGFQERADKRSVTVTLKNGQVLATRRFLLWNRYPDVQSGATINVEMKPEEVRTEGSNVDWDQIYNRTLQSTTTLLTLLVLIRQL